MVEAIDVLNGEAKRLVGEPAAVGMASALEARSGREPVEVPPFDAMLRPWRADTGRMVGDSSPMPVRNFR